MCCGRRPLAWPRWSRWTSRLSDRRFLGPIRTTSQSHGTGKIPMTATAEPRTNTDWLDESRWRSRIYLDDWRAGAGGRYAVVEPATGTELGSLGRANLDDVTQACARAAEAARAW